jgi:hypothetical protein
MNLKALNKAIKTTRQVIKFWDGKHLTADVMQAKKDLNTLIDVKRLFTNDDLVCAIQAYNRLPAYIKHEIEFQIENS